MERKPQMSAEEAQLYLVDYLKGRLDTQQQQEVDYWIAHDPACQEAWEDTQQLWGGLDALPLEKPSAKSKERFYAMLEGAIANTPTVAPMQIQRSGELKNGHRLRKLWSQQSRWVATAAAMVLLVGIGYMTVIWGIVPLLETDNLAVKSEKTTATKEQTPEHPTPTTESTQEEETPANFEEEALADTPKQKIRTQLDRIVVEGAEDESVKMLMYQEVLRSVEAPKEENAMKEVWADKSEEETIQSAVVTGVAPNQRSSTQKKQQLLVREDKQRKERDRSRDTQRATRNEAVIYEDAEEEMVKTRQGLAPNTAPIADSPGRAYQDSQWKPLIAILQTPQQHSLEQQLGAFEQLGAQKQRSEVQTAVLGCLNIDRQPETLLWTILDWVAQAQPQGAAPYLNALAQNTQTAARVRQRAQELLQSLHH
jgi:hypothetical protein